MPKYIPKDVAHIIGQYLMEWSVLPWVLERAPPLIAQRHDSEMILHWHGELVGESNSECGQGITPTGSVLIDEPWDPDVDEKFDMLENNIQNDDPDADPFQHTPDTYIWENPRAETFLRGLLIDWDGLAANPADWALDLLETYKIGNLELYPWNNLCRNTNPRARALWERGHESDLDWGWLSANPNAIDKIIAKWRDPAFTGELIDQNFLLWNPAAQHFIENECRVDIKQNAHVCFNPDPWPEAKAAQDALPIKTALHFGYGRNPNEYAIARMREFNEWTPRVRGYLYTNSSPSVLAMIRDNPEKFPLAPIIWSNPGIFELAIPIGLVDLLTSIEI